MTEQRFTVKFTDHAETTVTAQSLHGAEYLAEQENPGKHAFSARPEGCTGFAHNVHFGAENVCPIHGR